VGLSGPQQPCPAPARPRAPLTACGGKARANNRGLAGKERRSRASNGKIQLRGKSEIRELAASVAKVQSGFSPSRRGIMAAPL